MAAASVRADGTVVLHVAALRAAAAAKTDGAPLRLGDVAPEWTAKLKQDYVAANGVTAAVTARPSSCPPPHQPTTTFVPPDHVLEMTALAAQQRAEREERKRVHFTPQRGTLRQRPPSSPPEEAAPVPAVTPAEPVADAKPTKTEAVELVAAESKSAEATPAAPVAAESTPAEAPTAEPVAAEPKPAEPKPAEAPAAAPVAAEPKPAEPKPAEAPTAAPVAAEPKPAEPKPAEAPAAAPVAAEPKPAEAPAATPVAAEPKPAEAPAAAPVAAEPKPAEAPAAAPVAAEPKPAEPKPAEAPAAEATAVEAKPPEATPSRPLGLHRKTPTGPLLRPNAVKPASPDAPPATGSATHTSSPPPVRDTTAPLQHVTSANTDPTVVLVPSSSVSEMTTPRGGARLTLTVQASVRGMITRQVAAPMLVSYVTAKRHPMLGFAAALRAEEEEFALKYPDIARDLLVMDAEPPTLLQEKVNTLSSSGRGTSPQRRASGGPGVAREPVDPELLLRQAAAYNAAAVKVYNARQRALPRAVKYAATPKGAAPPPTAVPPR